jgi:hypothetical protein
MGCMTENKFYWIGIPLLVLATLVGLDGLYWLLFFLWRSAADPANNGVWHSHICRWSAVSAIALVGWIGLLVWIFKGRKKLDGLRSN